MVKKLTAGRWWCTLNESPSEKEGKFFAVGGAERLLRPSMKVPPKRKGNQSLGTALPFNLDPQ